MTLDIPEYDKNSGLPFHWEDGFEISIKESDNSILISANKAGLISLAIQLLTLAQDTVPVSSHFHYDSYGSLESGSTELVIQKIL